MASPVYTLPPKFTFGDWAAALCLAGLVELGLVVLLVAAGRGAALQEHREPPPEAVPIAINPVLDEPVLPLLKKGSKKRPKLPQMWQKPKPKKRYEDKSAPAVNASKTKPEKLPTAPLAKRDEEVPPEDAELAKKVDEEIPDEPKDEKEVESNEEGHEDGVVGGTEVDPLKALVVGQYRMKVIAWFKSGFSVSDRSFCGLSVKTAESVGGDRTFVSYSVTGSSGNPAFDALVRAHLDRKVGQQLPPPPPKYPDILGSTVNTSFAPGAALCKGASPLKE